MTNKPHWIKRMTLPLALSLGVNAGGFFLAGLYLQDMKRELPAGTFILRAELEEKAKTLDDLLKEQTAFNGKLYEHLRTGELVGMSYHEAAIMRDVLAHNIDLARQGGREFLDANTLIEQFESFGGSISWDVEQQGTLIEKLDELQSQLFEGGVLKAYQGKEAGVSSILTRGRFSCDSSTEFTVMMARRLGIDSQQLLVFDDHAATVVEEAGTTWKYEHAGNSNFRSDYADSRQGLVVSPSFFHIGYLLEQGYSLSQFPSRVEELFNTKLGEETSGVATNSTKRFPKPGVVSGLELPDPNRVVYMFPKKRYTPNVSSLAQDTEIEVVDIEEEQQNLFDKETVSVNEVLYWARVRYYLSQDFHPTSNRPTDGSINLDIVEYTDEIDWIPIAKSAYRTRNFNEARRAMLLNKLANPKDRRRIDTLIYGILMERNEKERESEKAIDPNDPYQQFRKALVLANENDPRGYVMLLGHLFENPSDYLRQSTAGILGRLGDRNACSHLVKAINDSSSNVGSAALEAIGNLKCEGAYDLLMKWLEAEPYDWRNSGAVRGLGGLSDKGACDVLMRKAQHFATAGFVRTESMEAVARLECEGAFEELVFSLDAYREGFGCLLAAKSLGILGDNRAYAPLVEALVTGDRDLKEAAAESLLELGFFR